MREGGELKIAMLQGDATKARVYEVPLAGFIDYSDKIMKSCTDYNVLYQGKPNYLPDYMSKEPEGYAVKDFSLKEEEEEVKSIQTHHVHSLQRRPQRRSQSKLQLLRSCLLLQAVVQHLSVLMAVQ